MKRKLFIGIAISGLFLYLALRGMSANAFAHSFSRVAWGWLVPAVAFTILGHMTRAWRWQFMMNPVRHVGYGALWSSTAIAFMVNNLLPARMGEFVRAWSIGRSSAVSKSAAFATIVYERIVDVFVLIALLWYCLHHVAGPDWVGRSTVILVVFNVSLFVVLIAMLRYRDSSVRWVRRICTPLPRHIGDRVASWADGFVSGLGVATQLRPVPAILILSVFVWGFAVLGVACSLRAMHLSLPPMASVFLLVVISLGSMIPSAPAYLGTLQYASVISLAVWSIHRGEALAFSTVYHATQFFPITIIGLYYAGREGLAMGDLARLGGNPSGAADAERSAGNAGGPDADNDTGRPTNSRPRK